jgi:hypothetical protein
MIVEKQSQQSLDDDDDDDDSDFQNKAFLLFFPILFYLLKIHRQNTHRRAEKHDR